jgi:hypothetical protein
MDARSAAFSVAACPQRRAKIEQYFSFYVRSHLVIRHEAKKNDRSPSAETILALGDEQWPWIPSASAEFQRIFAS